MGKTENKEFSFETGIARLEEIVTMLEEGNVPLDKSLQYFEEGVKLVKDCNRTLDKAEAKIKLLTRDDNGEIIEKDFLGANENGSDN